MSLSAFAEYRRLMDAVDRLTRERDDAIANGVAGAEAWLAERDRLRAIENAALRVASSRRNGVVTDRGVLDRLDAALAGAAVRETPQVTIDSANECPDCHGIPIKTGGPIVHAANCRIEPLFPGAADQPEAVHMCDEGCMENASWGLTYDEAHRTANQQDEVQK